MTIFFRNLAACGAIAILLATNVGAATQNQEPRSRPRIGLVLGGGGAKAAAHIGVLRVLEELRIPVDCVAGTSMGALVGATFAAGVSPVDIENQVMAVDWGMTLGRTGERDNMPIQRKMEDKPFTNSIDLGIKGGKLKGPGGFLNTQNVDDLLRRLVQNARNVPDFDALPIPFRAVATDMVAGEMVVLSDGDLPTAMRASMAVPGAFSPVVIGDKVLADGGQMRNVPVDIARQICGDVIIAVSVATPNPTVEELTGSSLALASRSLDVMIDANTKAQLATLTATDLSIVVQMGDITSTSFSRVPEAIPLGRQAALAKSEELARFSVSREEYDAWRASISRDQKQPLRIADVTVVGLERVNPEYVEQSIRETRTGEYTNSTELTVDSSNIFALGDFESVSYRVTDSPAQPTVEFNPIEKSWGPNFVNFDLGLSFADGGKTAFLLRAAHRRTWINSLGGEWQNVIQIGNDTELHTALYQPLVTSQRYFIEPSLHIDRFYEDIYDKNNRVAEYEFAEGYGQLDFGVNLGTRAQIKAGVRQSWNRSDLQTGISKLLPEFPTTHESNIIASAIYDTRDTVGLPTRGTLLAGRFFSAGSWLGGEESYDMAEALGLFVVPFRANELNVFGAGGVDLRGDIPSYRRFRIGGINSFPGLQRHQLRGDRYWLTGANFKWKLTDIQTLFNQALYAGLRFTAGEVSGRPDGNNNDLLTGLAVSLNGRTPIGKFVVSLGTVEGDSWALQLNIGRPMREGSIADQIW